MRKKGRALVPALLALAVLLSGCTGTRAGEEPKGKAYFSYFDTVSYVYCYGEDSQALFDERCARIAEILEHYHRLMDIYHEYSGMNNLCTVNRSAGGEPVVVEKELFDFMLYARSLYEQSRAETNPMLGAVLSLWHDCRIAAGENPEKAVLPTKTQLEEAARHTDFSLLELNEEELSLRISDPEASLDVGALGKGYATEQAAKYLESAGATGYVLNIGGNLRIIGTKPQGEGWITGIKNPDSNGSAFAASLYLSDTACVSSGSYQRYFTVDGRQYHHIIDPKTLYPAQYFSSVSVITKDSALADGLSTALFCLPYEQGLELAKSFKALEVLWIFPDGELRYTDGLDIIIPQKTGGAER